MGCEGPGSALNRGGSQILGQKQQRNRTDAPAGSPPHNSESKQCLKAACTSLVGMEVEREQKREQKRERGGGG